jgi:hypothetical protein
MSYWTHLLKHHIILSKVMLVDKNPWGTNGGILDFCKTINPLLSII